MAILEEGRYRARAVQAKIGRSEQQGIPFVEVMFEVLRGKGVGQRVRWRGYLNEKSRERTIESLRLAGWSEPAFGSWKGMGTTEVEIDVQHDTDENDSTKRFARVAFVNRVPKLQLKNEITDAGELAALTAAMGDLLGPVNADEGA